MRLHDSQEMRELDSQEVVEVQGGGWVCKIAKFIGEANAHWDNIDWSEVDTIWLLQRITRNIKIACLVLLSRSLNFGEKMLDYLKEGVFLFVSCFIFQKA